MTLADWVHRRASSLANLKLKAAVRVEPSPRGLNDIEMQAGGGGGQARTARAFSMPNFSVTPEGGDATIDGDTGGAYPV